MTWHVFGPSVLDRIEKGALVAVFAVLVVRVGVAYLEDGNPVRLVYVADQALVLVFSLFRRGTQVISRRSGEWFAGFAGTLLAFLIAPPSSPRALAPAVVTVPMMLAGMAIHLSAKLTLRRSFGIVPANRGLKVSGPYRLVRHPMYLGYIVVQAGLLLSGPNAQNLAIVFTAWVLFVWRIHAEERLLAADPLYCAMMDRTRFRLIPGIY